MEKIVTRAFIEDDLGKVMLGLRARGAGANQWALIGGKPEEGEDLADTVIREVKEETGLDFVPVFWKKIIDSSSDAENPWHVYLFEGKATGALNLNPDEILEVVYVSKENMDDLEIAFNHRELLLDFFSEV